MRHRLDTFVIGLGALALLLGGAHSASAELVFLTTGPSMSVKAYRYEGDRIVLTLRSGGEIECAASLIARIAPDEVPYPEPATAVVEVPGPQTPSVPAKAYGEIIDTVAARHQVDANLVRAVIQVESAYQPSARSRKGALGLMQLMPATAKQYEVDNPYDPQANIEGGVRHLKSLLDRFELRLALAAYNAGEAAVERFGGVPPYRETREYVARILRIIGRSE